MRWQTEPAGFRPTGAHALARASVTVNGVDTWYSVWGHGAPVVVFLEHPIAWAPPGWLSAVAGDGRRLLFPEAPTEPGFGSWTAEDGERFSVWLCNFLDGLGLDQVEVAAEPGFDRLLRRARMDHPDRIVRSTRRLIPPYRTS